MPKQPSERQRDAGSHKSRNSELLFGKHAVAAALETDLRPFVEDGTVLRLSRHDTNPANNLPIPAEFHA